MSRLSLERSAMAIGLGAVALRLPFVATQVWDHDSVQFALGVESFDLAAHHPHPPGYPIYLGILKVLSWFGVEPVTGMITLSVLASGLGAVLCVLLAARCLPVEKTDSRRHLAGLVAGVLYATQPLLWFYAEIPLIYAVEGASAVAVAWAALGLGDSPRRFYGGVLIFAVAGGLRPSTAVLLAPLFAWGLWNAARRGSLSWGRFGAGFGLGVAGVLAWALPLWHSAGGFTAYRELSSIHFQALLPQTSVLYGAGLAALSHNLEVLVKWTAQGALTAGIALLAVLTAPRVLAKGLEALRSTAVFLLLWIGPPMAFFALFHITKAGYTLIFQPALILVAALFLAMAPPRRALVGLLLGAFTGVLLFLYGVDRPEESPRWTALYRHEFNRGEIAGQQKDLENLKQLLAATDSKRTALVAVELMGTGGAGAEGFFYPWHRHLQWLGSDFQVLLLVPEQDMASLAQGHGPFVPVAGAIDLGPTIDSLLVVVDGPLEGRFPVPGVRKIQRLGRFRVLELEVPEEWGPFSFLRLGLRQAA